VEELLAHTINAAVSRNLIDRRHLTNVIVDSSVAPKAVAYPIDGLLLDTALERLVAAAKDQCIALKQTYAKEGSYLRHKAGRYAHARQFKRMRCVIRRQRTILGRLQRRILTKVTTLTTAIREALGQTNRVFDRTAKKKTESPEAGQLARLGSGLHEHGQGEEAVRIRIEGGDCDDSARQPGRGRAGIRREPIRRSHARRADRSDNLMQDTGMRQSAT